MATNFDAGKLTPDDHIRTLMKLVETYAEAAAFAKKHDPNGVLWIDFTKRATAIDWLLQQNAYGIPEDELVV